MHTYVRESAVDPQAPSRPAEMTATRPVPTLHDLTYMLFYAAGVTRHRIYPRYGKMLFRNADACGDVRGNV